MKRPEKAKKEYTTYEEYKQVFFPKSFAREDSKIKDPKEIGAALARQSLQKCRTNLL
jgi:hypothetical protein